MANESCVYDIQRRRVARMLRARYTTGFVAFSTVFWLPVILMHAGPNAQLGFFYWAMPIHLAFIVALLIVLLLPSKQASALKYWLDGSTLRIDEGVVILKRKSIPLDRITDVVMIQGPIMRLCGIWSLQIQTAGSNQQGPEGALHGVVDPESVRDNLMAARDSVVGTIKS